MNVHLTSTVKLNLVKFHSGTSMLGHILQLLADTYLKNIHKQSVR